MATQTPEQLDQNVVAMMRALREHESGNKAVLPQEKGIGGASIYQYTTSTWKGVAQKYLGDANAPLDRANENKATYYRIKEWKDKGFKPAQIASMWNAGEGEPDAYTGKFSTGKPAVGVNSYGVKYDVPAHAKSVLAKFQAEVAKIPKPSTTSVQAQPTVEQPKPEEPGFLQRAGDIVQKRAENVKQSFLRSEQPLTTGGAGQSPVETGFQAVGQAAVGAGEIAFEAAKSLVPDWLKKKAKENVQNFNKNLNPEVRTQLDKSVENGLELAAQGAEKYESWKKENPRAAANLEATVNIASIFPTGRAGEAALTGAKVFGQTAKKETTKFLEKQVVKKSAKELDQVADLVSPYLTKKEKQAALASGRGIQESAFKGSRLTPTIKETEVAEQAVQFVDPKKTNIENIKSVRNGIESKAKNLEGYFTKTDIPYDPKDFLTEVKKIEKPVTLLSDEKLAKAYKLAEDKFATFLNKNPKNLKGFLDARKQFDRWVEEQIPNVWEDGGTYKPVRDAIRRVRQAGNQFLAENAYQFQPNLQSPILTSLKEQSLLYEALDNIAFKEAKSLGQSGAKRFIEKRPLLKAGARTAVGGGLVGAGIYGTLFD